MRDRMGPRTGTSALAFPADVGRRDASRSAKSSVIRPFLKWAGGKRQLVAHLRRFVPPRFGQYFEPFFGSVALFFPLRTKVATPHHNARPPHLNPTLPRPHSPL